MIASAEDVGLITAGLGVIGAGIRWIVGRWEAQKTIEIETEAASTERLAKSQDRGTDALIANTASNAVLVVKIDYLGDKIDSISDFVSEHTPVGPIPKARTPVHGVRQPRPGTFHDEDK